MSINLNVNGNTAPLEAAVQAAITRIRRTPIKVTVDDKGATQPLGNMKRGADEFSKSMEAANARIIAFGASMAIINGVSDAFKAMVKNVVEVEKSLADINVVMGLSTNNLDKFSSSLFKVAKETGAAFNVAAEAATEYARQGLAVEETLKRTQDALILTRLTGMDSANAVKALTAAMNTYGDQIKDTTQLVSKFAAVDVKFAVSAEDFADAISRTGQAARSAGVDIDELVGLVTAAQQKTARGGKVIGNSFKTIFTRIGRTDTLNQLENLGIAVRDVEGKTIGAKRILTDLANTFDHLSEAQKAQIAQTVGGVFQINILKAVLSDAAKQNGILANATQISAGATDEAITKNEQLRQTMAAMATETGLALKEMSASVGELMLAPGMEKILNIVKSVAEGANDMLGGGESSGNSFAKGFLKGVGNIITGPGLVVIVAVFTKLLVKAVQYARESLTSLIGVTSEAQKQKAIQTSLVNLFGQNAALNKEMLRTDISRTEKEKIILGLLKAQVIEANLLNTVAKSSASNLYRQGYGANLAPRRGRASGHIPNFANPERAQAAQGGYAAGSIRSMNMPGEGSVIYNSAETVKNFAGFKQPAIMPPNSSKAGKNYQQAFGSIHGFDPYAAGGYVPNFARGGKGAGPKPRIDLSNPAIMGEIDKKTKYLNAGSDEYIGLSASLGPDKPKQTFYVAGGRGTDSGIYNQKGKSFYKSAAMQRAQPRKIDVEFKSLDEKGEREGFERYDDEINKKLQKKSKDIVNGMLGTFKQPPMLNGNVSKDLATSKMAAVSGHIFEAVTRSVLRSVGEKANKEVNAKGDQALIDLPPNPALYKLFNVGANQGSLGAEAKINTNTKNVMSFARKIYSSDPTSKTPLDLPSLPVKKNKAYGHIPNFANPLSNAIGREREAGVPVSKIRIGSHSALMNKSNPVGLGVTNTDDEPNGLKDVFGAANGFVPNYFNPWENLKSSVKNSGFGQSWDKATVQHTKEIQRLNARIKQREQALSKHNQELSALTRGTSEYNAVQKKITTTTQNLNKTRQKLTITEKSSASGLGGKAGRFSAGLGKAFSGNSGMMMMMGAPMAAGFLQQGGMGAQGGNQDMYASGGALSGAASGAMMASMIAPMFGPAAPLVIGMGGLLGGVKGWISATEENTKALKEKREQEIKAQTQSASNAISQVIQGPELSKTLSSAGITSKSIQNLGLTEGSSVLEGIKASTKKVGLPKSLEKLANIFSTNKSYIDEAGIKRQLRGSATLREDPSLLTKPESELTDGEKKDSNLKRLRMSYQYQKQSKNFMGMSQDQEAPMSEQLFHKQSLMRQAQKASRSEMIDYLMENEKKTSFAYNFGEEKGGTGYLDKTQYANLLKGNEVKVGGKIGKQTLEEEAIKTALAKESERIKSEHENAQVKQLDALILQLDLQKVQVAAQQAAAMNQLKIKDKYSKIADDLSFEQKIMGSFATDLQKSQNKYLKSMNKANEALALSEAKADDALRSDVQAKLKTGQYSGIQLELKQKLFGESAGKKTDQDVTDAMATKSGQELLTILQEIGQENKENTGTQELINKLIDSSIVKQKNELEIANKKFTNTEGRAKKEKVINDILTGRAEIIKGLERKNRMSSEGIRSSQKIRGFTEQVAAARRLNGGGLRGYQTGRERESFAMSEKGFKLESKITTLEENKAKSIGELNTEKEKNSLVFDEDKLKNLRQNKKDAEDYSEPLLISDQDLEILDKLEKIEAERIKKLEEIEQKIKNIKAETGEEIESAKKLLDLEKQRLEEKRKHETGPGAMRNGARDAQKRIVEQAETMEHRLGGELTNQFRNGLVDGMQAAINKADDLSDVMSNIAMNFLGAIQKAYLGKAADAIVGVLPFSSGGGVRKYSRGGGVPAMVTNGEYVMGKEAVNRYGGGFMHRLNAGGKLPGYSTGGKSDEPKPGSALAANFGGGEGYATGRRYQSQAMSGFFYSGRAKNVGLQEDTQYTKGIIQERMRKEAEKKAKKRALMQMIVGTALSVGVGALANAGIGAMAESGALGGGAQQTALLRAAPEGTFGPMDPSSARKYGGFSSRINENFGGDGSWSWNKQEQDGELFRGGRVGRYANGGHIAGKSGIDQIPAMLSEGEYVIRASSARQLGKPMLDQINAGKFNEGGAVTPLIENSETGTSGGSTNNINITVNMSGGKGKSEEKESSEGGGTNPVDSAKDEEKSNALAGRLKEQIITTIMEEQRPGGLLSG